MEKDRGDFAVMWETLNKIIQACFEVFFGTAVAGLVFYTIQGCRKNLKILLWLWLSLAGMMIWRFFIPNFYSPRYAAIFFFPAILLTAFMIVKFRRWWWLLVVVMGIVCCCKIFRPNLKGRLLIDAAEVIAGDAADEKCPLVVIEKNDFTQMTFYSPVPVCRFYEGWNRAEKVRDMSRIISAAAPYASVIYFCCNVEDNAGFSRKDLGLEDGEWKLIYSAKRSRKRNLYFHVYSYRPGGTSRPPLPPRGRNLILNGGAEKIRYLNGKIFQMTAAPSHAFGAGDLPVPAYWNIASSYPGLKFEIESSDDNPISGKRSFRLKTATRPCGLYSRLFTLHGRAEIFFRIRGDAGAAAEISLTAYDGENAAFRSILLFPVKILKDDQVMAYSFSFDPSEYSVTGAKFRLLFQCYGGEIFFDDVVVAKEN